MMSNIVMLLMQRQYSSIIRIDYRDENQLSCERFIELRRNIFVV